MTVKQAQTALMSEGVKPTDPYIDIIDAILEHLPDDLCADDAEDIAGKLAEQIAE